MNRMPRNIVLLACIIGLTISAVFVFGEFRGHFYVVSEGVMYRSRQLTNEILRREIEKYKIRSILNLRGQYRQSQWYQEETELATVLGVAHYDYEISPSKEIADHDLDRILEIIRQAPKPLLIHCKAGSDRTGLVAALYLSQIEGVDAHDAYGQLSIFYGHFPYLWSQTDAMDRTFWRYVNAHPR